MTVALFDIDGTIITKITRNPTSKQLAFTRAIEVSYGIADLNYMDYPIFGLTDPGILVLLLKHHGLDDTVIAAKEPEFARNLVDIHRSMARDREPQYGPLPGAADLLRVLRETGVRLGLATGNYEALARFKLEQAGLERFFEFGGYGEDGSDRAAIVAAAMERSGVRDLKSFVLVGDTPHDVTAGRRNGIRVKAVATGRFTVSDLVSVTGSATDVFSDLSDYQSVAQCLADGIRRKTASLRRMPGK